MADPIPLADFFDKLRIRWGSQFYLPGNRISSRTRGGEIIDAKIGNSLWTGSVTAVTRTTQQLAEVQGMIERIDGAGLPFLVHALPACGPAFDRDGAIIAGHSPQINVIAGNRLSTSIKGLAASYVLTVGDLLSVTYGSNPVRYSMHRVTAGGTANGSGAMTGVGLWPPLPDGVATNAPITLYKPVIKAVLVPDSVRWPSYGFGVGEISFDFVQTMR